MASGGVTMHICWVYSSIKSSGCCHVPKEWFNLSTALNLAFNITGSTILVIILTLREEDLEWGTLNNVYILLYVKGIVGS